MKKRSKVNNRAVALVLMVAALCLFHAPLRAADEGESDRFDFYKMEFKGSRQDQLVYDLNGNDYKDLCMIYTRSDKRGEFWLRSFLQDKEQGFTGESNDIRIPAGARTFDVGNLDGKPGAELVIMTDSGILVSGFADGNFGEFEKISDKRHLLFGTEGDRPRLHRTLWDLDTDGSDELIVPHTDGPLIYKYKKGKLELFQRINRPARVTYRVGSMGDIMVTDDVNQFLRFKNYEKRIAARYTVPDVFVEDFNSDGRPDIVTLVKNRLQVFLQKKDGTFTKKPAVSVEKSILSPDEKKTGFAGEAMTFADLSGDGLHDIIMLKWGTSEERTMIDRYIYFGREGLEYPDKPDQIIRSESATIDFGIYDLNKDDRKDVVIPFFHFAPAQALKVMTENAIKIQFRIFLANSSGRFDQVEGKKFARVDRRIQISYKIDLLGMIFDFKTLIEGKFNPLISFGHDFNGDGYNDLVADSGRDELEFYWGNKEVEFPRRPDMEIPLESSLEYNLADLNNDGKCDIITYYESEERTKKKRELARKARQMSGTRKSLELQEESALARIPEGTRIKVLISK
ncbi:MAG: VCBS repeat-containing protein [bacterium]